jgi:hypothetical protein
MHKAQSALPKSEKYFQAKYLCMTLIVSKNY